MDKICEPIFSIILPTHNRARMLGRAICSALAQTFPSFELIIIDDASADGTAEVVSAFNDPRVKYLRMETNRGAAAARNAGIRAAHGEFVSFLDDDDEFYPEFLAETQKVFSRVSPEVGFAWCGIREVEDTNCGEVVRRERVWQPEEPEATRRTDTVSRYLRIGTGFGLTVRKDCFAQVGVFDEDLPAVVDTDLLFRLGGTYEYAVIPKILVKVHRHAHSQLTDVSRRRAEALEQVIRKNSSAIETQLHTYTRLHLRLASLWYEVGNRSCGRQSMWKIIVRDPANLKYWKRWATLEILSGLERGIH